MDTMEYAAAYGITAKMEYNSDTKVGYLTVFDKKHPISWTAFEDISMEDAKIELEYCTKLDLAYKLCYAIMASFYKKGDDLVTARERVYAIDTMEDPEKRIQILEKYMLENKIPVVDHI